MPLAGLDGSHRRGADVRAEKEGGDSKAMPDDSYHCVLVYRLVEFEVVKKTISNLFVFHHPTYSHHTDIRQLEITEFTLDGPRMDMPDDRP